MIGNYLEAINNGADTIIITGSCGPCRYGEYCELQINLLKKLGHKIDLIVIDSPSDIGINEFLRRIFTISNKSNVSKIEKLKALQSAYRTIKLIDGIEARLRYMVGFEKEKGKCKRVLNECKNEALKVKNGQEMLELLRYYEEYSQNIEINPDKKPVKVAIMGEIYTILEPFTNLYIEDKLMEYGVSTKKGLYPSWWVKNMLLSSIQKNSPELKSASKEYLPYYIGGHAKECIGEAVIAHEEGYDGAIQIFPFGCMPEIVSKAILPAISRDKDFPIMTLVVDEMTGEAGYITRIEAFIDLLERRKKKCII
jgi:predicted nucleotide-binding protein (sugar kinase/HSP70/actin superfamily)